MALTISVEGLIAELEKIEDKTQTVMMHAGVVFNGIRRVSERTISSTDKFDKHLDGQQIVFLHRAEV